MDPVHPNSLSSPFSQEVGLHSPPSSLHLRPHATNAVNCHYPLVKTFVTQEGQTFTLYYIASLEFRASRGYKKPSFLLPCPPMLCPWPLPPSPVIFLSTFPSFSPPPLPSSVPFTFPFLPQSTPTPSFLTWPLELGVKHPFVVYAGFDHLICWPQVSSHQGTHPSVKSWAAGGSDVCLKSREKDLLRSP